MTAFFQWLPYLLCMEVCDGGGGSVVHWKGESSVRLCGNFGVIVLSSAETSYIHWTLVVIGGTNYTK